MKLSQLSDPIRQTAVRGGGFGSDVEQALLALADLFAQNPEATTEALEKALKPKVKKTTTRSATFEGPTANPVIQDYLDKLATAETLEAGKALIAELRVAKKVVPAAAAKELAGRFLGAKLTFKSRDIAIDAIEERIGRKDWDKGALELISRTSPSIK